MEEERVMKEGVEEEKEEETQERRRRERRCKHLLVMTIFKSLQ